jgi:hypothetical protein
MSAILTLIGYNKSSASLNEILNSLNQGDVFVLHSQGTCALVFHKCITANREINVFYKNVNREKLLGKNGWEKALYVEKASECYCIIDDILRVIWGHRSEKETSKGSWSLLKE